MTDPATAWAAAKLLGRIAKDAGKIELYQQAIELQSQISDMIEEDRQKSARIHELEQKLKLKDSLDFRRNAYWTSPSDDPKHGPYCPTCYGAQGNLVHLTYMESDRSFYSCGSCKNMFQVFPERYEPPRQARVKW
jgi:hypothetical protein